MEANLTDASNVHARAVNTVAWLSAADTAIVVPIYQRQYRWDIGRCEQLLTDVRAVADYADRHTHFLGSILSSSSQSNGRDELVLIDGQQRMTTLMLLAAAVQHTVRGEHPDIDTEIQQLLVGAEGGTKLRPHMAWAAVFEDVVLGRTGTGGTGGTAMSSRFHDNYAFFRSQISPIEAPRIWRGLGKLEHVAIGLGPDANAQQIFESLNSTGEPLRDEELIHNYVLMGLTHAEQQDIEDRFWTPIERATGDAIGRFWRHYLVMTTGREVAGGAVDGDRSIYDAFRAQFPRLDRGSLPTHAAQWLEFARIYQVLLEPDRAADPRLTRQLRSLNVFGPGMYPLIMRAYHDHLQSRVDAAEFVGTLIDVQALLLRRTVAEIGTDRLVARLCRAVAMGSQELVRAMARITPSDERVRVALKYRPLPHAGYVLAGLAGVESTAGLDVEHVFPLHPADRWTGDGHRVWATYSEDEQNSHRALTPTLGNLALIESVLADRAEDLSFPDKRSLYSCSEIALTTELADLARWDTAAIAARTAALTADLVRIWARPGARLRVPIDDDGLTPILDAIRRRGWPRGWQKEFDYVEYCGEHWEVPDVKYLFNRVFKRLWADARPAVQTFVARRGGPIFDAPAWNGQWDELPGGQHLYMGWDSKYMLTAVQGVLDEAGLASDVYVKYSYLGEAM